MNYSTLEGREFSRYLMLSRDKLGMDTEITYQSYTNNHEYTVNITSVNDDMELFRIGFYNTAKPLIPVYSGDIAVIVDPNCISTGEGFAMMFQRLENAKIVSHWGTNGAFGMVDYEPVILPLGFVVSFPQGRSLNENNIIQLDSDSTLKGGISPDIIVPLTAENVKKQWEQQIDVQLEYAQSLLLKINENTFSDGFKIYPNPCSKIVNIEIESQNNSNN